MALLQVSQHLLNDPKSIKAIYSTFDSVEEVTSPIESLYKTFRVTGQGVPLDDKQIIVGFEHGLDGLTKINGWDFANRAGV